MLDLVDEMLSFEAGELGDKETLELFSKLIMNRMSSILQGYYGRFARDLILNGYITPEGDIVGKEGV